MLKGGVNMVITLDAGHYGKYNQSPVIKEFYESEFNWKLTNRLAQYLRHYGITVRLTRSNINRDLSLFNRGESAPIMTDGVIKHLSYNLDLCPSQSTIIAGTTDCTLEMLSFSTL